jgi:hypothetical protein
MSTTLNIDEEWENFMYTSDNRCEDVDSDGDDTELSNDELLEVAEEFISTNMDMNMDSLAPKSTDIYISTKTKIAYLNSKVDLKSVFWNIPVIPYTTPKNGVVKKQIKFNSLVKEDYEYIKEKLLKEHCYDEHVITHIDNPNGRIPFKDVRKVSIGISKKDIMSYRIKKKSAFYNCFVVILRLKSEDNTFKEYHVKVFNTGKIEIPGVRNEGTFISILKSVIEIIHPFMNVPHLFYNPKSTETVLINSNFNCGFFINREILFEILIHKYNMQCIYDSCSYPGIQCKFYYNPTLTIQSGRDLTSLVSTVPNKLCYKVSFMIFRTGSVLIVGKCDEQAIMVIYNFLKILLNNEYKKIAQKCLEPKTDIVKIKKHRKKIIMIESTKQMAEM